MRNRSIALIIALLLLGLLAVGGTVGVMAMTQSGFMTRGYGNGMMGNQQYHGNMMGRYQQNPSQQGMVTGNTHPIMQNYTYQPANMQVRVGTTVTWTNQDSVPHSVTFKNGMKDSGLLTQGQSFSYTFNTPGTYQYYCTVHPYMVATVSVVS